MFEVHVTTYAGWSVESKTTDRADALEFAERRTGEQFVRMVVVRDKNNRNIFYKCNG